jgi:hypothetical protein
MFLGEERFDVFEEGTVMLLVVIVRGGGGLSEMGGNECDQ